MLRDAAAGHQLLDHVDEQVAPLEEPPGVVLNDDEVGVHVDDEPAEPIPFAVHPAERVRLAGEPQHVATQRQRALEALAQEAAIDRPTGVGAQQPHGDRRATVIEPAPERLAVGRQQGDLRAVVDALRRKLDLAPVHPRVKVRRARGAQAHDGDVVLDGSVRVGGGFVVVIAWVGGHDQPGLLRRAPRVPTRSRLEKEKTTAA